MKIQLSEHFTIKKLLRYAMPSIGMMIFTSIYGVVDGYFVSNYTGVTQFAAVCLIYPFIMILSGVGFMLGSGGTALVAMILGTGDKDKANRTFSMILEAAVISGLIATVIGVVFMEPIAIKLGADGEMLPYCVIYGRICVSFTAAFMLQQMFQTFFSAAEKPKLGFLYTVAAGVTNMFLDWLFVGMFKWGVNGAAYATGFSMCVGGIFPLIYFFKENDSLLRFKLTAIDMHSIGKACYNGASEMVGNIAMSVVGMVYNYQLLKYLHENGVAAYGVLMYVNFIFISAFIGFDMGVAPIISYHYGAGDKQELKGLLRKGICIMSVTGVAMLLIAEALASPISMLYVGYDAGLMELTVHAFRIYSFSFIFSGVCIFASSFFTALNNGTVSAIISFARTFVLELVSVLVLPQILGEDGIWLAIIVAELGALILSAGFLIGQKKKYGY